MRNHHRRIPPQGFTLLELLITLALASLVLGLGVPAFTELIRSNRHVSASHTLLAALNLTRSEAIKRGVRVTMCRSIDLVTCDREQARERIWDTGWIVFIDADENGLITDPDDIIRVFEPIGGGITIRSGGNYSNFVAYLPLGNSRGNSGLSTNTFRICDARGSEHARSVITNIVGRVRTARTNTCG